MENKMFSRYCLDGETEAITVYMQRVKVNLNTVYQEKFSGGKGNPPVWKDTTYLMTAISKGNYQTVEVLLQNKANPNFTTDEASPLSTAVRYRKFDIVELLLKYGAKFSPKPESCFVVAVQKNDSEMLDFLLNDLQQKPDADLILAAATSQRRVDPEILDRVFAVAPKCDFAKTFTAALDNHRFYLCNWLLNKTTPEGDFFTKSIRAEDTHVVDYLVNKKFTPTEEQKALTTNPALLAILNRKPKVARQEIFPRRIALVKKD